MRVRWPALAALLTSLAVVAPASGAEQSVDVVDFDFTFASCPISVAPCALEVQSGDTVTWIWGNGAHTTTSRPEQPESWNSHLRTEGATFSHTFSHPGRYQYICIPHADIGMKGTVVVGHDAVNDTVDRVRTKRIGRTVKISFKLNEAAVVTYRLRGPSRRTVARGRLEAGMHSFRLKRLKEGSYHGRLRLSDDFDNTVTPKKAFTIS
jgi:plastocyanin